MSSPAEHNQSIISSWIEAQQISLHVLTGWGYENQGFLAATHRNQIKHNSQVEIAVRLRGWEAHVGPL
jgi:hypothetical protein